jgi:hypothetical protein
MVVTTWWTTLRRSMNAEMDTGFAHSMTVLVRSLTRSLLPNSIEPELRQSFYSEIANMLPLSLSKHGFQVLYRHGGQALTTDRVDRTIHVFAVGEKLDSVGKGHEGTSRNRLGWLQCK